jgi:lipopolysaccharide/colanic/teichoic acid biosynthesis glycosyltransferase
MSIIGLMILSPIFVFLAIWIKLGSKGPVFYKQIRIGKHEKEFALYKFRSMYLDSDKKGLLTIGGKDPRVTKAGYFIRKFKLDEFPQLINVVKNDMSLVGPRPEVAKYVNLYNKEQKKILQVKPGITDYASLEYRNENDILALSKDPEKTYVNEIMPLKLELNKKYIQEASLSIDIKIIIKTVVAIITK